MVKIKIVTSELSGRQVGRIVDLNALDSDATLKEALDYGYATGTFTLEVITTGEKVGEITLGQNVLINGKHLTMGEGDSVKYLVPETGLERTVSASYITSDETRITVARDGMQELFEPEMDGKTIVWLVKIGNKVARKSAVMHYVA